MKFPLAKLNMARAASLPAELEKLLEHRIKLYRQISLTGWHPASAVLCYLADSNSASVADSVTYWQQQLDTLSAALVTKKIKHIKPIVAAGDIDNTLELADGTGRYTIAGLLAIEPIVRTISRPANTLVYSVAANRPLLAGKASGTLDTMAAAMVLPADKRTDKELRKLFSVHAAQLIAAHFAACKYANLAPENTVMLGTHYSRAVARAIKAGENSAIIAHAMTVCHPGNLASGTIDTAVTWLNEVRASFAKLAAEKLAAAEAEKLAAAEAEKLAAAEAEKLAAAGNGKSKSKSK